MVSEVVAILLAIVLLYILIKGHVYLSRRIWNPVFEEEADQLEDGERQDDRL